HAGFWRCLSKRRGVAKNKQGAGNEQSAGSFHYFSGKMDGIVPGKRQDHEKEKSNFWRKGTVFMESKIPRRASTGEPNPV
ncbi:MAG TPA: hypothetical protein VFT65_16245, partial [Candidatus Angelobacter sp.]|nr:hypothetical protein [Candidatus Angelobacter sp.]